MDSSSESFEAVELLADEFMQRQRAGEQPTIDEYVERHPELAGEIREVFPALAVIEQIAPVSADLKQSQPPVESPDSARISQIGDYRILREIGRGGMGVVYEAEQESLRRRVALKVLPRQFAGDQKALERFQREARAAARMHHTNIVPVFDVGDDEEHVFYAMQLIQGQGLDVVIEDLQRLRNEHSDSPSRSDAAAAVPDRSDDRSIAASLVAGQFEQQNLVAEAQRAEAGSVRQPETPPSDEYVATVVAETKLFDSGSTASAVLPGQSEISSAETDRGGYFRSVAQIGHQTAGALAYAHARGIIHRDIKPSNLLLDTAGVVWVTDFGLAKTGDEALTHTGDILGTIRYMSPERFQGRCDVRADVYSLGLTLYEMLTLKPAFSSPDRLKLIEMVATSDPPSPRSIESRIPRDLETIILKSIDKDPRRRYQSADDLADDLELFIHDEPIHARRTSTWERFGRWSRRNKALASSLAAVVVLLVLTAITAVVSAGHLRSMNESLQSTLGDLRTEKDRVDEAARRNRDLAADNAKRADDALAAQAAAEDARTALRQQLYISDMKRVRLAYQEGAADHVNDLLKQYLPLDGEPDLRGWEWYYWWRASHLHVRQIYGSSHINGPPLREVAVAPDFTWVAVRVWPSRIVIFDTRTRAVEAEVTGAPWGPNRAELAISPDGRVLAAIAGGGGVKLWRTTDWSELPALQPDRAQDAIAFSPLGLLAVGDTQGRITFWNVEQPSPQGPPLETGQSLSRLAYSPDGSQLATGSVGTADKESGGLLVWNLADRSVTRILESGPAISALQWTQYEDQSYIAAGLIGGNVRVFEGSTFRELHRIAAGGAVSALDFSPDGSRLAAGTHRNNVVHVWETVSAQPVATIRGHSREVLGVGFVHSGQTLWSCSNDGALKTWDVAQAQPFDRLPAPPESGGVKSLTFGADQRSLWRRESTGRMHRWNLKSGEDLPEFDPGGPDGVTAISDDGRFLAVLISQSAGSGSLEVWRTDVAEPVLYWRTELPEEITNTRADQMSVSNDGTVVAWARAANVTWFDISSGDHKLWQAGGDNNFARLALSPDGTLVAVPTTWNTLLFDVSGDQPVKRATLPGDGPVYSNRFSPNGRFLATGHWNNEVRIHDATSGQLLHGFRGHAGSVRALAFSPDSALLASCAFDGTVRLWSLDPARPGLALTLSGHGAQLTSVAFSPDGRTIASVGAEGNVRLWSRATEADMRGNSVYWVWRAEFHEERNEFEAALADWTAAIELTPDVALHYQRRGDVHLSLELLPEAIDDFQTAMSLVPPGARKEIFDEISALSGWDPLDDLSPAEDLTWRFTFEEPQGDWQDPDYDDADWQIGGPRFRNDSTIRGWPQRQIWLRKESHLTATTSEPPVFLVNADDYVTIYVNGRKAASATWIGSWRRYQVVPCDVPFRVGRNVLAVHCENTGGQEAVHVVPGRRASRDKLLALWSAWLELEPDSATLRRERCRLHVELGRWHDAALDMEEFTAANPTAPSTDWMRTATLHAMAVSTGSGPIDDYRRVCNAMVERFHAAESVGEIERTLKCCLLIPTETDVGRLPTAQVTEALTDGNLNVVLVPWFHLACALLHYRTAEFTAAEQQTADAFTTAEQNVAAGTIRATAEAIRSLALAAQERHDDAQSALDAARQHLSGFVDRHLDGSFVAASLSFPNGDLNHDLLIAEILIREAEAALVR